ncbi:MAG TPA: 50S ribosomal protein L2 [Candidatus Absconditabacterales bacterium]|nr:50S ribosomal protein L2 [Candidatus Absconditabacterales bacterium]HOQ79082.1 50S ribosomal protein L2 [Candidatus Absconditabacterales bacterium]HPK27625.1 50S ribosomal protein L2 [Candidatus Absconditabacterales bacterium]
MAIKTYKPYTPSRRFMIGYDFSDLTTKKPEKSLTKFLGKTGGRNNKGRITTRARGGGHKRLYRLIDFRAYDKIDIPAKVASIEYDPYRTCRIALLNYVDGEKRYVLARKGISVGETVMSGENAEIKAGNRKRLKDIPEGVNIFNLEITPQSKGKLVKSAGTYATISGKDDLQGLVFIKLPSGEVRKFNENCRATIGEVSNEQHKNIVIGKAGRQRRLGKKPKVLGVNMNPVDHPHGGGEAHADIGLKKGPKSFTGKLVAPGIKTRKGQKWSDKFIVSNRKKK